MMEAVRTSETSVDNQFTRQYNPEDSSEQHTIVTNLQNLLTLQILPWNTHMTRRRWQIHKGGTLHLFYGHTSRQQIKRNRNVPCSNLGQDTGYPNV
jgi:hypothetical protein